ncbi:MAG: permease [Armatimonadia bacterium]|nr:permease [Armatimonadia bacterium]
MAGLVALWTLLYRSLIPISEYLAYELIGLTEGTHLGEAIWFFIYEVPKVLMLLALVVFGVGVTRTFFTPERTRAMLAGRHEGVANGLAAVLGVVTPFCSCSAVPLFIGFVEAGVPLGVTLSFLISAPMVNEVALVLLFGLVGWQVAAIYLISGLVLAIVAGWVIGRLGMDNQVEDWVYEIEMGEHAGDGTAGLTWSQRIDQGVVALRDIFGRVWLYVVIGIAVGAGIHGYVPEDAMARIMGSGTWWSVPAAVLIAVPMYSNAVGVIPVVEALLGKGAALGTVLAFMMSVIALSLPEGIILRKVLKPKLIAVFFGTVALGIVATGFLFNAINLAVHVAP